MNTKKETEAILDSEDMDLSDFGLYREKDPTVPEEDYFLTEYTILGRQLWARKSDKGKKWQVYEEKPVKKQTKRKKK